VVAALAPRAPSLAAALGVPAHLVMAPIAGDWEHYNRYNNEVSYICICYVCNMACLTFIFQKVASADCFTQQCVIDSTLYGKRLHFRGWRCQLAASCSCAAAGLNRAAPSAARRGGGTGQGRAP
jgi:hypothetical protein